MSWKVTSVMSQRLEFVILASAADANMRQLCRRFQISPTTGYKWLRRFASTGAEALRDRSRRPRSSPTKTAAGVEEQVVLMRLKHPAWGGRKLRARLSHLGQQPVPSASTITAILHRQQLIDPHEAGKHRAWRRFVHPHPNDLWQIDFKGDFPLASRRCHPLTVLDDHSRFALALGACADQSRETKQAALTQAFRRYGLPHRMTMDNGAPSGSYRGQLRCWTEFTVWLLRLGIAVTHSRPGHPQTQGKDERFHRTLQLELLRDYRWRDFAECQAAFDTWRDGYNCERPHEALAMAVPAQRYQPSPRHFPESLPPVEYPLDAIVRKVGERGQVKYQSRKFFVGHAFKALPVALRPTATDGILAVIFCQHRVAEIDLRQPTGE